jgi:hypothetical protein
MLQFGVRLRRPGRAAGFRRVIRYLRPFSIRHGWLAPVAQVSAQYGDPAIWPGDTFGISVLPGRHGAGALGHVALSWGSAVGGSQNSEIYATVVGR